MTRVEMLWESCDPARTLHDRFGFTSGDDAASWVGSVLREHYGQQVEQCDRIVMSDVNALAWVTTTDDQGLLFKSCVEPKRFTRLADLAKIVAWLDEQQLPVSAPLPTLEGCLQIEADGASLGVQRLAPGDWLDTDDLDEVVAAGECLANLHIALASCPFAATFAVDRAADALAQQISEWTRSAPSHLPPRWVDALPDLLGGTTTLDSTPHLVHGDFRSANLLMVDGRVSAVLDFEEARWDHPVVELARQAVLLGTRFHHWAPVPGATHRLFRQGYEAVRPLSEAEDSWWRPLVLWFTLLLTPPGDDPHGWGESASSQLTDVAG